MLKLHFGCGMHPLPDWINSDISPAVDPARQHGHAHDILMIDIREPLPYSANSADYIFHEHLIEHVSVEDGVNFLMECHRVLKPNGKMRIITPSFEFLIALTNRDRTQAQFRYLQYMAKPLCQSSGNEFINHRLSATPCAVLNRFFRDWGHDRGFIYDQPFLVTVLNSAGFNKPCTRIHQYQQSTDPNLRGIDQHHKSNQFSEMESMIVEVTK